MNRVAAPITGVFLTLFVAGCASTPSSTSQQGGSAGKASGTGGSAAVSSAGGGVGAGGSSGSSSGNSSETTGGTSGGGPTGGTGGSTAGSSPGGTAGSAGGSAAGSPGAGGDSGGQAGTAGASQGGRAGMATGGNAGAGAGTAGAAPTVDLPELVTSAEGAYWNTMGQVTDLTTGTADLTVDESTLFQRWDGFGGCFNEMGWDALSVVSSEIPRAMKLLFDPVDGANFLYGRLPLGASDYSMSWYTLDDTTAADYTMDHFSIDRDNEKLIPFIQAALLVRPDLHLWASPWVVPSWMMDNGSNMKNDAQTLGAHALYMTRFVEEYAKVGLNIEAIHPQNEPGYARVHWTQAELIDFMKTYLAPTLAQHNLSTEIWCGTMSKDPDDTNIAKAAALDADAMKVIKGFGVQWNLEDAVATLATSGPVMQTEHRCGNYTFDSPYWDKSRYSATKAQNDHLYGEESWQLIRDWIVSGVNSYSAWNMVLDTVGKSLDSWPQNALLVVDRTAKTLTPTAAYYAFRHYSQYIAAGATRVGLTGSTDALAFKNPDGSVVTEVYNSGTAAKTTTVGIGTALYQFDVPAHGWATLRITP